MDGSGADAGVFRVGHGRVSTALARVRGIACSPATGDGAWIFCETTPHRADARTWAARVAAYTKDWHWAPSIALEFPGHNMVWHAANAQ